MGRNVSKGTPEQFYSALENRIAELEGGVNSSTNLTAEGVDLFWDNVASMLEETLLSEYSHYAVCRRATPELYLVIVYSDPNKTDVVYRRNIKPADYADDEEFGEEYLADRLAESIDDEVNMQGLGAATNTCGIGCNPATSDVLSSHGVSYRVYELDEDGDEVDLVGVNYNESRAISFASEYSAANGCDTHVVAITRQGGGNEDPYTEVIWSSNESVTSATDVDMDDTAGVERYIHTLIGDLQSALEDEGIFSTVFDSDATNLYVTVARNDEDVQQYEVPLEDLKFDWDNINQDVDYIFEAIVGDSAEAVESATSSEYGIYQDSNGIMGEIGDTWTVAELREYWDAEQMNDPVLSEYDSFDSWLEDTTSQMTLINACDDIYSVDVLAASGSEQTVVYPNGQPVSDIDLAQALDYQYGLDRDPAWTYTYDEMQKAVYVWMDSIDPRPDGKSYKDLLASSSQLSEVIAASDIYQLNDLTYNEASDIIRNAVKSQRRFIGLTYKGFGGTSSSSNFMCAQDGWNWVNRNGQPMNMGTANEKNSYGWSDSQVIKELCHILKSNDCIKLEINDGGVTSATDIEAGFRFGEDEAEKYGDLIREKLKGKTISKRRDLGEQPGGLVYEAEQLGIDMWDLLKALEGMRYDGRVTEVDDSTYLVNDLETFTSSEDIEDEYETSERYFVYDDSNECVSDGFEYEEDAIEFADENGYPEVKVHRYFTDESGKLRPDGHPETVYNSVDGVVAASEADTNLVIDIDPKKVRKAARAIFKKIDDIENEYPEIDLSFVETASDIGLDVVLLVNYGLEDGEDYQLMNEDILIVNESDERWAQVASDLNYTA